MDKTWRELSLSTLEVLKLNAAGSSSGRALGTGRARSHVEVCLWGPELGRLFCGVSPQGGGKPDKSWEYWSEAFLTFICTCVDISYWDPGCSEGKRLVLCQKLILLWVPSWLAVIRFQRCSRIKFQSTSKDQFKWLSGMYWPHSWIKMAQKHDPQMCWSISCVASSAANVLL